MNKQQKIKELEEKKLLGIHLEIINTVKGRKYCACCGMRVPNNFRKNDPKIVIKYK